MYKVTGTHGNLVGFDVKADIEEVRDMLRVSPKVFKKATIATLNEHSKKIQTQVRRQVAGAMGVQQKVIKNRITRFQANYRRQVTGVYYHYNPIDAIKVAPEREHSQDERGVFIGEYFFEGAFFSTPTWGRNKGRKGVYKRKGKKRMPIDRQYVAAMKLHKYVPMMEAIAHSIVAVNFVPRLIHAIKQFQKKERWGR